MAIDTRDKRASAVGEPPEPDGDLSSAADRRHMAGLYRGITTASAASDQIRFTDLVVTKAIAFTDLAITNPINFTDLTVS